MSSDGEQSLAARRIEWICLGLIITFASLRLPRWTANLTDDLVPGFVRAIGFHNFRCLWFLLFGILLIASSPRRYGIRIGNIREHAVGTVLVCLIPIALTAIVYPRLSVKPWSGGSIGTWLISPPAQNFVFIGFLYAKFEEVFPGNIHERIPVRWALLITGLFFAAWHVPNFRAIHAGYVVFQLFYTFAGCMFTGLSRQWTGSILYCMGAHMAGNWIAVTF